MPVQLISNALQLFWQMNKVIVNITITFITTNNLKQIFKYVITKTETCFALSFLSFPHVSLARFLTVGARRHFRLID